MTGRDTAGRCCLGALVAVLGDRAVTWGRRTNCSCSGITACSAATSTGMCGSPGMCPAVPRLAGVAQNRPSVQPAPRIARVYSVPSGLSESWL